MKDNKINRAIKPDPTIELSFVLPEIETFKLKNALEVLYVRRDNLPIIRMNLVVNGGSRVDPKGKKGLANLFAMMIDEGAGEYNGLELMDEFDTLGSNFDTSCNNDGIYIGVRTLTENFDRSLELYSKVIKAPHFDKVSFAREKRKVLIRLLQQKDDVEEIATSSFEYLVLGKTDPYAYPVSGYEEDVKSITLDHIKEFYSTYFYPNNAALIVVGDIERYDLECKLNESLKEWEPQTLKFPDPVSMLKPHPGVYVINKSDAVQSEIRIGHISKKRNKHDFFQRTLLNTILGGQFSSRINLNLREAKGYTYGAFTRFNYYKDSAYFFASTSVAQENTLNAVNEIIKELKLIKNGVSEAELEFAKRSTIRKYPSNFETNRQIAYNLTTRYLYNLPDDYFQTYPDKIRDVSLDEIIVAAKEHILPDDLVILLVGDKSKIVPQLNEAGFDNYTELDYTGRKLKSKVKSAEPDSTTS